MFRTGDIIHSQSRNIEMNEGRHNRAKLGFILMSTDLAAESDFFDMVPKNVAIHITRLKTDDYTTNKTLSKHIEHIADAASRIQPDVNLMLLVIVVHQDLLLLGKKRLWLKLKKVHHMLFP